MTRVPVGRSIAHAYEFLFGRFFQIIGTAWLPAVMYAGGYYAVLANAQGWVTVGDPASLARAVGVAVLAALAGALIQAVIAVSLTQEALGIRKDLALAHFVVGPRELRLFFGLILYFLLFAALYVLVAAVSIGLMFAARKYGAGLAPNLALHGIPAAVVAAIAIDVVVLAWFWLSMLRLFFLLAPVASVEHRFRLARAWELTRGSTLRTFVVLLVVLLPVMTVAWAAIRFVFHIGPIAGIEPHARPAEIWAHILQFYAVNAGPLALISGVLAVLNGALLAGASAAAYRTVVNHEEVEPEDDAALVAPLLVAEQPSHDNGHGSHDHVVAPVEQHGSHEDHGHGGHEHDAAHGNGHGHDGHGNADQETHGHGHSGDEAAHNDHGHDGHAQDDHGDAHANGDHHGDHGHNDHDTHGSHDGHDSHGNPASHDGHGSHGGDHGAHGHGHHASEPEARAA